jgi:hypothetical protein
MFTVSLYPGIEVPSLVNGSPVQHALDLHGMELFAILGSRKNY